MKYVHVSAAVPEDIPALYMKERRVLPGQQAQKYNRLFGTGFKQAGFDVVMLSQVPLGFKDAPFRIVAPDDRKGDRKIAAPDDREGAGTDGLSYSFVRFANIPLIKNVCADLYSRRFVKRLIKEHGPANVRVTCDLLSLSAAMGAIHAAASGGALSLGVITDLPEHLSGRTSSGFYGKLFLRCVRKTSGIIAVTEAVGRRFDRPFVVIEGISAPEGEGIPAQPAKLASGPEGAAELVRDFSAEHGVDFSREKVFFYAGGIEEAYGVKLMVDAYIKANIPDSRLLLFGGGAFGAELSRIAAAYPRIIFAGMKSNRLVTALEKEAFLLINPRTSAGEFTEFSFPSKNMEYMCSGTPMAGFMLPGIPAEYWEHMFVPAEETADAMGALLAKVAEMPADELARKGAAAAEFVRREKGPAAQASRVVSFFDGLAEGGISDENQFR